MAKTKLNPPKLSRKSREVVERALRAMLRYPDTYDQNEWIHHDRSVGPSGERPAPYCGTTACIAGHIALAAGGDPIGWGMVKMPGGRMRYPDEVAEEVLRCRNVDPHDTHERLFIADATGWPDKFNVAFHEAKTDKAMAKVAVSRVRHWLKTGE